MRCVWRWNGLDEALDACVFIGGWRVGAVVVVRVVLDEGSVRSERTSATAVPARATRPVDARCAPRARYEPEPAH